MLRFTIFGIPVEVQPFFWVMCVLLSGNLSADSWQDFLGIAVFVVAAFLSVLVHELGHALSGLRLGGGAARIELTSFGGLAINVGGRFGKWQRFWMIAAGPGAGFALLVLLVFSLGAVFRFADAATLAGAVLFDFRPSFQGLELVSFLSERPFVAQFIANLVWINFWWGVINLLPVMPLDGGQITDLFVKPQRRVYLIGLVAAGAMALVGLLWLGSYYTAILFGYFAWKNYQSMQAVRWQ